MARHIFDRILSLEEAAERSGLSASWLRRLVDDDRLPAKKVGKTWLVLAEDVDALVEQERPKGRPMRVKVGGAITRGIQRNAEASRPIYGKHPPARRVP